MPKEKKPINQFEKGLLYRNNREFSPEMLTSEYQQGKNKWDNEVVTSDTRTDFEKHVDDVADWSKAQDHGHWFPNFLQDTSTWGTEFVGDMSKVFTGGNVTEAKRKDLNEAVSTNTSNTRKGAGKNLATEVALAYAGEAAAGLAAPYIKKAASKVIPPLLSTPAHTAGVHTMGPSFDFLKRIFNKSKVPDVNVPIVKAIDKEKLAGIYKKYPKLAEVGDPDVYSEYLHSIFPENTFNDIVHRYQQKKYPLRNNTYFHTNDAYAREIGSTISGGGLYGGKKYGIVDAIVNAKNARKLDEINYDTVEPFLGRSDVETLVGPDTGQFDIMRSLKNDDATVFVKDKNNIHILGDEFDLNKFSNFVKNRTKRYGGILYKK